MESAENRKLIYQVSRVQGGCPVIYSKHPLLDNGESYNIWIKRACKKGYVDLVNEDNNHWEYMINDRGKQLLENNPEFRGLQYKLRHYNKNNFTEDDVKARRRERRRLRKLRQEGIIE